MSYGCPRIFENLHPESETCGCVESAVLRPSYDFFPQKLIKELPSLVPGDEGQRNRTGNRSGSPETMESSLSSETTEHPSRSDFASAVDSHVLHVSDQNQGAEDTRENLNRSPGEVAFFKLLHAEFKKAIFFFEKAQQEFVIREERVREGSKIMEQPNSIMVNEKWSLLAKSIFRLYKDLLLFETFAIMTYCSFSKILKKHDKVTGHNTRAAFMANIVNKANFTSYPKVLEMIRRCEALYDDVSKRLVQEGKEGLYEDERLFINMISRLNEQALDTAEGEGAPSRNIVGRRGGHPAIVAYPKHNNVREAVSSLRSLVEENDAQAKASHISDGHLDADSKPSASDGDSLPASKRRKA